MRKENRAKQLELQVKLKSKKIKIKTPSLAKLRGEENFNLQSEWLPFLALSVRGRALTRALAHQLMCKLTHTERERGRERERERERELGSFNPVSIGNVHLHTRKLSRAQ
jgi:hypothetical protein